jgi:hypothetical protein
MKEQKCEATVLCNVSKSVTKFARQKKAIKANLTLCVRMDKLISWQVNEGTVFADLYLMFSTEGCKQQ